jgi:hypothetical protein
MFQEIFLGAGRTLELIETKEIEQLLKTIIDVSTCTRYILSVPRAMPKWKKCIVGSVPLVTQDFKIFACFFNFGTATSGVVPYEGRSVLDI